MSLSTPLPPPHGSSGAKTDALQSAEGEAGAQRVKDSDVRLCEDPECSSPAWPGVFLGGTMRLRCAEGTGKGPVHELDFSITPEPASPGETALQDPCPLCAIWAWLVLSNLSTWADAPQEYAGDTSFEMPTTASPASPQASPGSPAFPWSMLTAGVQAAEEGEAGLLGSLGSWWEG